MVNLIKCGGFFVLISNLGLAVLFLFLFSKPVMAANSGNFTMSLWVNPTTSVASKALVSKAEEFRVFTNASGFVGCQIKTTTWQTAAQSTTKALVIGNWSLVICTYDLTSLKVYVNGTLTAQTSLTSLPDDTAAVLRLGQDDSASTTYTNLAGTIDEFRFYNYALTSDEVNTEYNRGSALTMGSLGTSSTNPLVSSNSSSSSYCPPGNVEGNCASGLNPAPVAEWNFEEGSGTSVSDNSGNGNTGTWNGNGIPHWVSGKIGKAGNFISGDSDYVNVSDHTTLKPATTMTVEAWVYLPTVQTNVGMVGKEGAFGATGYGFNTNNGGKIVWSLMGQYTGTTNYPTGQWAHYALVYDGANVYGYINTIVDKTWAATGSISHNTEALKIGRTVFQTSMTGKVDQVRIFNYARTAAQIAWDYNRGGPVGWWKMNECTGTAIHDSSGNSNTGTLTGATAGTCDDASGTSAWNLGSTGKYGASLKFDGVDDRVNMGNPASLQITGNLTVSAWIKRSVVNTYDSVVSKDDGTNRNYQLWIASSAGENANKAYFSIFRSNIEYDAISNNTLSADVWYHLVGVNDGTVVKLYVNGVLQNTTAAGGTIDNDTNNFWIGDRSDGGGLLPFSGQIDDVQIFNYALTATQVKTLYNENAAVRFGQ